MEKCDTQLTHPHTNTHAYTCTYMHVLIHMQMWTCVPQTSMTVVHTRTAIQQVSMWWNLNIQLWDKTVYGTGTWNSEC